MEMIMETFVRYMVAFVRYHMIPLSSLKSGEIEAKKMRDPLQGLFPTYNTEVDLMHNLMNTLNQSIIWGSKESNAQS